MLKNKHYLFRPKNLSSVRGGMMLPWWCYQTTQPDEIYTQGIASIFLLNLNATKHLDNWISLVKSTMINCIKSCLLQENMDNMRKCEHTLTNWDRVTGLVVMYVTDSAHDEVATVTLALAHS